MRKLFLLPLLLGLLPGAARAQGVLPPPTQPVYKNDRIVTGTVTDFDTHAPMYNVSVRVRGTQAGTTTDENGQYAIRVPNAARASIYFRYGGYAPVERYPRDRRVLDVRMWRGKNPKLDSLMDMTWRGWPAAGQPLLAGRVRR